MPDQKTISIQELCDSNYITINEEVRKKHNVTVLELKLTTKNNPFLKYEKLVISPTCVINQETYKVYHVSLDIPQNITISCEGFTEPRPIFITLNNVPYKSCITIKGHNVYTYIFDQAPDYFTLCCDMTDSPKIDTLWDANTLHKQGPVVSVEGNNINVLLDNKKDNKIGHTTVKLTKGQLQLSPQMKELTNCLFVLEQNHENIVREYTELDNIEQSVFYFGHSTDTSLLSTKAFSGILELSHTNASLTMERFTGRLQAKFFESLRLNTPYFKGDAHLEYGQLVLFGATIGDIYRDESRQNPTKESWPDPSEMLNRLNQKPPIILDGTLTMKYITYLLEDYKLAAPDGKTLHREVTLNHQTIKWSVKGK